MRGPLAAALAAMPLVAQALTPSEVFEKVSPSVWAVRSLDAQERPFSYGSAVVVGPGQLVTNCHVLAKAKGIQLRRENITYDAKLEHADVERDLCMLSVKNLNAPPVTIGKLSEVKVGQRVFAIGNPERLALTLSEGLVSGLRGEEGNPVLQTTAPISPGSSGGGLFDDRGHLLGITSFGVVNRQRTSQNLNFAVPAEWIAEAPERAKALLAKRAERAVVAGGSTDTKGAAIPGLPATGASWKYSYTERQYSTKRFFTVRVSSVEGRDVRETFQVEDGMESSAAIDSSSVRFAARRLTNDYSLVELAPYFLASDGVKAFPRPASYPGIRPWTVEPIQVQSDTVLVPAGSYKATRVDVKGSLPSHGTAQMTISAIHVPARFEYTAWYAHEIGRYVMFRHQTYNVYNALIGDEVVQLLEYRPK